MMNINNLTMLSPEEYEDVYNWTKEAAESIYKNVIKERICIDPEHNVINVLCPQGGQQGEPYDHADMIIKHLARVMLTKAGQP